MAAGWFHQTLDLIAYGRIYSKIHRQKDAAAKKIPGRRHREVGHEYYKQYGILWNHENPFPPSILEAIQKLKDSKGSEAAEEMQVAQSHDYLDRVWDDLSKLEREYWEGCFVCLLYHPDVLQSWAKVDVLHGRIHRIQDGKEIWEDAPEIVEEYRRLRREVSRHQKWRLRGVLTRYCG